MKALWLNVEAILATMPKQILLDILVQVTGTPKLQIGRSPATNPK